MAGRRIGLPSECAHDWMSTPDSPASCVKCGAPYAALPLPRKPKREGPPLEGTVVRAIREAFAALPYVTCWRNNTGGWKDASGHFTSYGLCEGSSDLVGIVRCDVPTTVEWASGSQIGGIIVSVGRFFALEVRQPGKKPTSAQHAFLDVVCAQGGAAGWVDNVADALAFIEGARRL